MSERDNSREPGVHRLVDMVVEEVSLVDRAANKKRYLLVKRSEDMAGENTETDTDTESDVDTEAEVDTDTDDTDDDDGDGDDAEDGAGDDGDDETDKEKPKKPAAGATTEAVVTALEALSGVVEMLANKAAAPPKKKPPGRGGGAGGADDDEEDADSDEEWDEDDEDAAPPARGRKPPGARKTKNDPLAQVAGALKRLEALVGGKTPQAKRAPAALGELGTKLDTMTTAIGDLKKLVTGQGERIGKVEKTVGLPASRPVEGKGRRKDDDVVSWPLDINAPRDRKSVAKEVSFHD
jgi:hypothetical protein